MSFVLEHLMKFIEFVAIIKSINLAITIRMKNDYAIIVVRHRWSFVSLIFTSFNFIKLHSMNSVLHSLLKKI